MTGRKSRFCSSAIAGPTQRADEEIELLKYKRLENTPNEEVIK
jgi:hypothetical protein